MTFKLDASQAAAKIAKLRAIQDKLPQMAGEVAAEAQATARIAAFGNIYSTTVSPNYTRTMAYLNSLSSSSSASGTSTEVTVQSNSPYAAHIEYGREKLSGAVLQHMALMLPEGQPLTLGRSGLEWWRAGPILISAQAFAYKRLKSMFAEEVAEAMR